MGSPVLTPLSSSTLPIPAINKSLNQEQKPCLCHELALLDEEVFPLLTQVHHILFYQDGQVDLPLTEIDLPYDIAECTTRIVVLITKLPQLPGYIHVSRTSVFSDPLRH